MDEYDRTETLIATAWQLSELLAQGCDDTVKRELDHMPMQDQRDLLTTALCLMPR